MSCLIKQLFTAVINISAIPEPIDVKRVSDQAHPHEQLENIGNRNLEGHIKMTSVETDSCSRRLRCLVRVNQLPGDQYSFVRKPPGGLRGWLIRSEKKLRSKVHPEAQNALHLRGHRFAQDFLLQALLKHSQLAQFCFVVDSSRRKQFEQWAATCNPQNTPSIEIHSVPELVNPGLDAIRTSLWLDLGGDCGSSSYVRDRFSHRVFPVISVQHGIASSNFLHERFLRTLLTPNYACDSLVCTSRACRKALMNIFEEISASFNQQFGARTRFEGRFDVIPLCVDTNKLRPRRDKPALRKRLRISEGAVVLLYIGYLSLVKADLIPLLQMIRTLVNDNPNVGIRLVIAGTGPRFYSESLRTVIRELHLETNVTLFLEISDDFKEQLLGVADIFLGPCDSVSESFGLTPVEAMACGVPQVVADWSGYRDTVLHGETGFLVPTCWGCCDEEVLATGEIFGWAYDHTLLSQSVYLDLAYMRNCIQTLIQKPELRRSMSERSRSRAIAEFSYLSVARRYDELWTELMAIAETLQPRPKTPRFDQPKYYGFFGHFASRELDDNCVLRATAGNYLPISRSIHTVQDGFPDISLLDETLLERLVQIYSSNDSITVSQLISSLRNESTPAGTVRRHILFLLKHGELILAPKS